MLVPAMSFKNDEAGSVLAEFALVLPLFLILLFAVIDFGQIYLHWILAEKATHLAARQAIVRPPLCSGVPTINDRAFGTPLDLPFGSSCGAATNLCADRGVITCTGATADSDGFNELITQIRPLLPATVQPEDIRITYTFANLGFLGGPYVPLVSIEFEDDVDVPFITPLGPLLQAFYGGGPSLDNPSIPSMRATLPAEDLVEGGPG